MLTWSAVPHASEYHIYQAAEPYGIFNQVGVTTGLSWSMPQPADGRLTFRVTAAHP